MIKSDAKQLHSFKLSDFSGGINADSQGTERELLQCLNTFITSKGHISKRGGSKLLNQFAPVGYQEKEVWGYLLACEETQDEYANNFLSGGSISASSFSNDAHNPDKSVDGLATTHWQYNNDLFKNMAISSLSPASSTHEVGDAFDGSESTFFENVALPSDTDGNGPRNESGMDYFSSICHSTFNGSLLSTDTVTVSSGQAPRWHNGSAGGSSEMWGGYAWGDGNDTPPFTDAFKPGVTTNAWVKFYLGAGVKKIFDAIYLQGGLETLHFHHIKTWELYGSNDDISYTLITSDVYPDEAHHQLVKFENNIAYSYYKLVILNRYSKTVGDTEDDGNIVVMAMQLYHHRPWLDIDLGSGVTKVINKISLYTAASNFKDFVVYASTDQNSWINLYEGITSESAGWQYFNFINPNAYRYYRVRFTSDWSGVFGTPAVKIYSIEGSTAYPSDEWLKYDLGVGVTKVAAKLIITPYASGVRLFTLYGSNDDSTYTSIYSSICDAGNTRQEFILNNIAAYRYYKLIVNTAHEDNFKAITEWELMEVTTSSDKNYYIFKKTAKDIIRKVTFPSLQSMLNFVSYWKAKTASWATTYYCTASDFDIDDNGDISTKVIAEGEFTINNFSEAILDSKINEYMSVFALLREEQNNEMFGVPQAWKITSGSTAITSMHELKRRDLRQTYTYDAGSGVFASEDAEPEEYVQNKFIFVTADNAILTANHNTDLTINGFNVIKTGLKRGANCCWVNFQNRAFMVDGAEGDCDMIWTDGENVYDIGIIAPTTAPTDAVNSATGGYMADGEYYFKYLYHRTTYGANNSGFSPEIKVTLALGKGEIESFTFTGGTGYAVGQILTVVQSGASGGTFRVDTVDSTGVIQSLSQLSEGALYSVENGLATTVNVGGGSTATISILTITDVAKTQKETFNVLPSSDSQVDKIYLYRTKLNDYVFYKCAEIDNVYDPLNPTVTLSVSSTANDNSLAVGDLADDNYGTPPQSKFIAIGGNKMWYATENAVYFSKLNFPEDVPIVNYIPVSEDDGEKIMGMCVVNTWLLVLKETKTFAIDVNEPMAVAPIMISDTLGLVNYKTLSVAEGQVAAWISQVGPCVSNGTSVIIISKGRASEDGLVIGKIYDDFANNFDHSKSSEAFAVYYPKRQQYWFHVPYLGGYYRTWIYDVQISSFYKYSFAIEAENYILLTDDDNTQRLVSTFTKIDTAKYYGYIMIYDESNYQDTSAITLAGVETKADITIDVITAWSSLGIPERIKSFRMIYAEIYAAAAATIIISCGIDHKRLENKQILLNGSIDTTASVNVVGVGTYFLTELKVGDNIIVGTETRIVATITDNTHLTVTVAFSNQANDTSIYKIGPGIHAATVTHPGEVGTAQTVGKDEIEGFDYGRVRSLPSPVDGVGTYFSIRMQHTGSMALALFGYTMMFRLRGARP